MSPALHPSFSDPRRSPPALSSTPTTFDCLFFFIYCECYGFEWTFFTHRRFLPYTPSQHFWHIPVIFGITCFYQDFTGSRELLFWKLQGFIRILETKPSRSVCLIHSNPHSSIHLNFVFMYINIASFTCDENFDKISSHTIQQPWKYKAAAKLISNQNISAYLNCSLKKCISRYNCN